MQSRCSAVPAAHRQCIVLRCSGVGFCSAPKYERGDEVPLTSCPAYVLALLKCLVGSMTVAMRGYLNVGMVDKTQAHHLTAYCIFCLTVL